MRFAAILLLLAIPLAAVAEDDTNVTFKQGEGRVSILIGGRDVAAYVYDDPVVKRPYFCQVKTLSGIPVTRPYPPDPVLNKDNDDHETMHPGLWLAFGDINGVDFWRNKGVVKHVEFAKPFLEGPIGQIIERVRYTDRNGVTVCNGESLYAILAVPQGYQIVAATHFRSPNPFSFGDQEEMGFGVRVNTPLTVEFGKGEIKNSEGGINEQGTWGKQAEWCAYSGLIDNRRVGIVVTPDPTNFRPSWFHTRDYGLLVANPFAKKAMTAPDDKSVPPDKTQARSQLTEAFPPPPSSPQPSVGTRSYKMEIGFTAFIFDVPQNRHPDYNQSSKLYESNDLGFHVN